MSEDAALSKTTRLHVGAYASPRIRGKPFHKNLTRKVARVDADGKVVGYTSLSELQDAVLTRKQIELELLEGQRPKEVICTHCGHIIRVSQKGGHVPTVCRDGCDRRCSTPGCTHEIGHRQALNRARNNVAIAYCFACSNAPKAAASVASRKQNLASHCGHGHAFTPENTITKKSGSRACRACHNAASKERSRLKRSGS